MSLSKRSKARPVIGFTVALVTPGSACSAAAIPCARRASPSASGTSTRRRRGSAERARAAGRVEVMGVVAMGRMSSTERRRAQPAPEGGDRLRRQPGGDAHYEELHLGAGKERRTIGKLAHGASRW